MYNANEAFVINCLNIFLLRNNLDSLENSIKDNEKIHIQKNKYTILLINIKINNKNNMSPVLILL
tara:strand:- start:2333 stop:2527 length:195 start_codon:yes stop_codon:yes gene_type:complete